MSAWCLLFSLFASVGAEHWAILVAGSNGYGNYRHQADTCHAYQVLKAKGIKEENIIHMAYDDIAHNQENPFKGKLFNKPDPKGPGKDVYAGCKIDYKGKQVNTEKFIGVITGNGTGKVLKSTKDDHVFINFVDHGAPGLIAFPSTELHKKDLQTALKSMHEKNMFKKLVFYLETCESGSMFEGMKIPGVYAVSAANGKESSWGTYCPGSGAHKEDDMVNGKHLQSCLGDLFSVNWMEDDDAKDTTKETLLDQFLAVQKKTNKSHVMAWGDKSFQNDTVSEYIGSQAVFASTSEINLEVTRKFAVSAREIDLHRLYVAYSQAETGEERSERRESLQNELKMQQAVEETFERLLSIIYQGDEAEQKRVRLLDAEPEERDCELGAHVAIREACSSRFNANSGFALKFHQIIVNICADVAQRGPNVDVVRAAAQACSEDTALVV